MNRIEIDESIGDKSSSSSRSVDNQQNRKETDDIVQSAIEIDQSRKKKNKDQSLLMKRTDRRESDLNRE